MARRRARHLSRTPPEDSDAVHAAGAALIYVEQPGSAATSTATEAAASGTLDPPLTDKLRFAGGYQNEEIANTDTLSKLLTIGPEWHSKLPSG